MAKSPPPVEYRFKKGHQSAGRPRGSRNKRTKMRTPALDEGTKYPVGGGMRRLTRREAIMRYARDRALALNDPQLTSLLVEAERKAKLAESLLDYRTITPVLLLGRGRGGPTLEEAVKRLGLGKMICVDHSAQRVAFYPEAVSVALMQLGDKRLSRDEQKLVLAFTITPYKVEWPDWWEPDLRLKKVRVPARYFREDDAEWERTLSLISADLMSRERGGC
jgi:hypothetical protein